jgi:hypothetical protein
MFILLARYATRLRTVGIKGLYWDDLFCLGVMIFNTSDAVTVHIIHHTGESSIVTPKWLETATQADIDRVVYGSKLEYVAWCGYASLIWCMKFAMLLLQALDARILPQQVDQVSVLLHHPQLHHRLVCAHFWLLPVSLPSL